MSNYTSHYALAWVIHFYARDISQAHISRRMCLSVCVCLSVRHTLVKMAERKQRHMIAHGL